MKKAKERMPSVLLTAALLIAWQIGSDAVGIQHIFPSPVSILKEIWILRETLLFHQLPTTMITIAAGWGLSIVIGVLLAYVMDRSERAEAMLYPALVVTQTVPVMCITPLFVLWFGYTLMARLLAVVLSTFFAITLNTYDGFHSIDRQKAELMRTCGASERQIFRYLKMPTALPKFMTALKMTFPWAVIDAAVAEWLGSTQGLGYFSKRMVSKMNGPAVFAPVVVLCAVALIGMAIINRFDRKFAFYRSEI